MAHCSIGSPRACAKSLLPFIKFLLPFIKSLLPFMVSLSNHGPGNDDILRQAQDDVTGSG